MNFPPGPQLAKKRLAFAAVVVITACVAANAAAANCPRTKIDSAVWIDRSINSLVLAAHAAYTNESAQDRYQRIVDGIAGTIQRWRLAEDSDLSQRYPEFFDYIRLLSLAGKDDHELGFEVSDKQYFAETTQFTTIPEFLLTPTFLRAVSGWENLPRAKTLLREMNKARAADDQILFLSYSSRHLGTPDNPNSYRRLLIIVPGNAATFTPEKWVQFGIADPRRPRTTRNVSVVAVLPRADETAGVYFKDSYRTYRRNGSISIKGRWELGEGDDPCVTCHKSGVLPVFPVAGTVASDEKEILEAINARFRGYGAARFGRYIDSTKFGPGLGTPLANQESRTTLLTTRFNTQGCTVCHNTNGLGAFNWPMDSTIIKSFVTGGKMPLNANLSGVARAQLYKQLVNEYFAVDETRPGILQAWLLGKMRVVQGNEVESNTP